MPGQQVIMPGQQVIMPGQQVIMPGKQVIIPSAASYKWLSNNFSLKNAATVTATNYRG
jgi:hypothetical protein